MTNTMQNMAIYFLSTAPIGAFVEDDNKYIEVVNMCGGRFLCYEDKELAGLTDDVQLAVLFMREGVKALR